MENNCLSSQSIDVLDFLDEVKARKVLDANHNFDIVDTLKAFYDQENFQQIKMSESDKQGNGIETLISKASSTVTRMSDPQESDLERYQYLYEERAAIIQFEWLFPIEASLEFAESEAMKEVAELYATENQILVNSPAVSNFIKQLTNH